MAVMRNPDMREGPAVCKGRLGGMMPPSSMTAVRQLMNWTHRRSFDGAGIHPPTIVGRKGNPVVPDGKGRVSGRIHECAGR